MWLACRLQANGPLRCKSARVPLGPHVRTADGWRAFRRTQQVVGSAHAQHSSNVSSKRHLVHVLHDLH